VSQRAAKKKKLMKRFLTLVIVVLSFVTVPATARAQEKQQPAEHKMVEFHMALLKRGPNWPADGMTKELQSAHVANAMSLLDSGKAVIAGPLGDDGDIIGIYVLRAKNAEEAKGWAESDPAVKAGNLVAEMHPWWSEEVMKKPAMPIKMATAYLGLLKRGPKWTPEKTPATEEIQKAHMANIIRLAETKKLVVAGPFGDNGTLRGIFVFKVATLEEAKELAETDPAVKAGRLAIEMHPWLVPEGVLP
jgi:uncharacterized protein